MKILLVKPFSESDHIQPSLGLGYLATAVRDRHDVAILDCIKEKVGLEELSTKVAAYAPDVIGFQCYTFDVRFIHEALRRVKAHDPRIRTVIGGPHPSSLPMDMFQRAGRDLDFSFIGEAEAGFSGLVDALERGPGGLESIPGLVWRAGDTLMTNTQVFADPLDSLGMPAWDLIHPERYPEAQHGAFFKKFPIAPIMLTRGCPYPCTFCAAHIVSGRKVRKRSVDAVLREIRLLYDDFGIREFHVIDDNFTLDPSYAKQFLNKLKDLRLDISWAVPNGVRMDTLDEELLGLMKESGLYLISLGIESGSDKVLRLMKKNITTDHIRKCVGMIRSAGIDIAGFFIIGFPEETAETIRDTIRFSLELDLVRANFFTYLPFPGTESYRHLQHHGELGAVDWERFHFTNAAYVPQGMSRKQLKNLQRLAFARFFLRPRIIWYNVTSIRSFRHLTFLMKRFIRWIIGD